MITIAEQLSTDAFRELNERTVRKPGDLQFLRIRKWAVLTADIHREVAAKSPVTEWSIALEQR